MNKSLKSTLVLVSICAVIALALAVTNAITAPLIEKNQAAAANQALLLVMPDGGNFEKMDLSGYTLPKTVTEAYRAQNGGYVFRLTTSGYAAGFEIMCGVNADGSISGATCLSSGETLGYEKSFGDRFAGLGLQDVEAVDTISGATKTTGAYRAAVADAIKSAIILGGGSVDLRTEEEILAENLATALPAGGGKFTKLFIVEEITGINAVYVADNGAGYVLKIGEEFIAADADATVLTPTSQENAELASSQLQILLATTLTDLDLTAYTGLPTALKSAKRTATGNYVLELDAAGYGINGGNAYHPASGEYIRIRVSLTSDGKILDCLTVSQAETENIGSVCGDASYYEQYVGKTQDTLGEVDAISGATMTSNGYQKAIERAFASVAILEGGAADEE